MLFVMSTLKQLAQSTKARKSWQISSMGTSSSTPPAPSGPSAAKHLRPELAALVRTLAALPEAEREIVYVAVSDERARSRGTLSWDEWEKAKGVVSLGGNAVEDCDGLYDEP
ncbi:MAG TPA: hypothetical protein VFX59_05650 [Polyangiales bacterium]|nr:hypothetical protein [Polyangiales bacterium]